MSWNFFFELVYFRCGLMMERAWRFGQAILNPCYNYAFRKFRIVAEEAENASRLVVTTTSSTLINMSSIQREYSVEIPAFALNETDQVPKCIQRSCVVEMAPFPAVIEQQEEPPSPVEIAPDAIIPIETPRNPKPRYSSIRSRRMRQLRRIRRLRRASMPTTSSSFTAAQSSEAAECAQPSLIMFDDLARRIPDRDRLGANSPEVVEWIDHTVDTTGCSRGIAVYALFRNDFDFAKALAFIDSTL